MVLHDISVSVGAQGALRAGRANYFKKHHAPRIILDPLCTGRERRYVASAADGARIFDCITYTSANTRAFTIADNNTNSSSNWISYCSADTCTNTTRATRQRGRVSMQWCN